MITEINTRANMESVALQVGNLKAAGCTDDNAHCLVWADRGECQLSQDYMLQFCRVSCGVCQAHACAVDSDICLQQSPGWDTTYTCAGSNSWCSSYSKDMHRCCAETCGVSPVCDSAACSALTGAGHCIYPNPAMNSQSQAGTPSPTPTSEACAVDSDICLRQSTGWGNTYTCAGSNTWCSSYSKDMHRCCAETCGVSPVCDATACSALTGNGHCIYPNPAMAPESQACPLRFKYTLNRRRRCAHGGLTSCPLDCPQDFVEDQAGCCKACVRDDQIGINYNGNDESEHRGIPSILECSVLCAYRGIKYFTYGTASPYTQKCWCKTVLQTASALSSVTSGNACEAQ